MLLIRVTEVKGSLGRTFVHHDQKPCPCIQVRQNGSPLGLSAPRPWAEPPVRRTKTSSRGSQTESFAGYGPAGMHCDECGSQMRLSREIPFEAWSSDGKSMLVSTYQPASRVLAMQRLMDDRDWYSFSGFSIFWLGQLDDTEIYFHWDFIFRQIAIFQLVYISYLELFVKFIGYVVVHM